MNRTNRYCVILAGGLGTRFWPISKAAKPKQFLDGKDDAYVAARFDCACELSATKGDEKSRKDAADIPSANHELSAQDQLDAAKKRYNERMDGAWKDEPKNKEA